MLASLLGVMIIFQAFPSGPLDTNVYVVACSETHKAAVIDPASGSTKAILPYLEKHHLTVDKILITHSHWDHVGDAALMKKRLNAPLYIHGDDADVLRHPPHRRGMPWKNLIDPAEPDVLIKDGDTIAVGNVTLRVLHTPGHTRGSVCFLCSQENVIFTGDTLFQGSIGRTSFPESAADLMWPSLDRLAKLPPETHVYPGHGDDTTIAQESWLPRAREIFSQE